MQRTGIILVVSGAAGYAWLPIFVKWAYQDGLQPMDVLTWRFVFAALGIWVARMINGALEKRREPPIAHVPMPVRTLVGMGVLFVPIASLAFLSLDRIPASLYIVLAYLYPAFVALISSALGERMSIQAWLVLSLTLVGVVLTVPDLWSGLGQTDLAGVFFGIGNGLAYAFYIVFSARYLRGQTAIIQGSSISITTAMVVLLGMAAQRGLMVPHTPEAWISVVGMGLISTAMPITVMLVGVPLLGATRAAIVSTLEAVFVLALSWALLGERLLPVQVLGGALILASAVLLQLRPGRPERPKLPAAEMMSDAA